MLANHLAQKNQVLIDRQKKLALLEQEISRIYEQESRIRSLVQVFIRPENADSARVAAKNQQSVNYLNSYVQKVKAFNQSHKNDKVNPQEFIPNIWPVSGIIGQKFMDGKNSSQHHGLDIIAENNALVVSAAKGIVIQADWDRDLGKYVKVEHDINTVTLYAHLSRSFVQVGDQVEKGNTIGTVGNTGNSLGPHLHFEIFVHGNPVDPLHFLK